MIQEFSAFFALFRQGKELANAATWKQRTVAANAIGGFLAAALVIAKGFGYDPHIDADTLQALAAGIAAAVCVFNAVMHCITSARAGLPAQPAPADDAGSAADYRG